MSLSAYALTSLADQKAHMRITSSTDDALLTTLINANSAEIERVTGRQFLARDRRAWLNVNGQRRLALPNPPLQKVDRVAYGCANAFSIQYTGSGIEARVSVYRNPESPDAGAVRTVSYSTAGVKTETNSTFASNGSTSALATTIGALSGWTATALVNIPSGNLHPTGGINAKSGAVSLTYPDQLSSDFSADYPAGTIEFATGRGGYYGYWPEEPGRFAGGHQSVLVEYRSGYETIPEDVSLLCREMVKEAWYAGQQNTSLAGYSLGPYSLTFNQQQTDRVRSRLAAYVLDGWVGGSV